MSKLIEKARARLHSFKLEKLVREIKTSADSHCIVTYPDSSRAYETTQERIFKAGPFSDGHKIVTYPDSNKSQDVSASEIFGVSSQNSKSSENNELAVYLHIPFCASKCTFCQYNSNVPKEKESVNKYLAMLKKEIVLASEITHIKVLNITTAYIGGGTPTYLTPKQINDLVRHLNSELNLKNCKEFTVEASPDTILGEMGGEMLDILRKNNVTRLSIGVQTLDDSILSIMGRSHNADQALSAIKEAREHFNNVNIDLIVGFPNQSLKSWKRDLISISDLEIPSITVYPLSLKPTAKMFRQFMEHSEQFPDQDSFLLRYAMAIEQFENSGYKENPVWWFTKSPEYINHQQIHKWRDNGQLLALGVSGYSYINNWQYFNQRDFGEYYRSIGKGSLPIWKGAELTTCDEQGRRNMVFGIRCGVDKKEFFKRYGYKAEERFKDKLNRLKQLELVRETPQKIEATYAGRLFIEEVVKTFVE